MLQFPATVGKWGVNEQMESLSQKEKGNEVDWLTCCLTPEMPEMVKTAREDPGTPPS